MICVLELALGELENVIELSEVTGLDHAVCFVKNQKPQVLDLTGQVIILKKVLSNA